MTISTVDAQGMPRARVLILKAVDDTGWHFAVSSVSQKGRDLAAHPVAACAFYWPALVRQVRVVGTVVSDGAAASADDFRARPLGSRAMALTLRQSQPMHDAGELDTEIAKAHHRLSAEPDYVPDEWTSYAVRPTRWSSGKARRIAGTAAWSIPGPAADGTAPSSGPSFEGLSRLEVVRSQAMLDKSEIRFLPVGARRLAYEVRGDGPPLVAPAWWVSHLELDWQSPDVRRFWAGVAENYTLIRYDRLGVGMSDREVHDSDLTLDGEVATLCALLDELGLDRVSLIGGSSGSSTAVAFAAAFPERVERLVLYGSYSHGDVLTAPGVGEAIVAAVRAHWGLGARMLSDIFLGSAEAAEHERFTRLQRESATAETAAALLDMVYRLDVRAHLPLVRSAATVVHRRDDRAVPYRLGREVAAAIPGATFIPLHGHSHFPWHGDVDSVVRACRQGLALASAARRRRGPAGAAPAVASRARGSGLRRTWSR